MKKTLSFTILSLMIVGCNNSVTSLSENHKSSIESFTNSSTKNNEINNEYNLYNTFIFIASQDNVKTPLFAKDLENEVGIKHKFIFDYNDLKSIFEYSIEDNIDEYYTEDFFNNNFTLLVVRNATQYLLHEYSSLSIEDNKVKLKSHRYINDLFSHTVFLEFINIPLEELPSNYDETKEYVLETKWSSNMPWEPEDHGYRPPYWWRWYNFYKKKMKRSKPFHLF